MFFPIMASFMNDGSIKDKQVYFQHRDIFEYLHQSKNLSPAEKAELQTHFGLDKDLDPFYAKTMTEEEFLYLKSKVFGIDVVHLSEIVIDPAAVRLITEDFARKYTLIPVAFQDDRLLVAIDDPMKENILENLMLLVGNKVKLLLAHSEDIKIAIRELYTVGRSMDERAATIVTKADDGWDVGEKHAGREAPVVSLVDSLLRQAVMEKASDIHWEPMEIEMIVKFRIDGVLYVKEVLPKDLARSIAARLKVMSGMDVTLRRLPQDGRIILNTVGKKIDVRVATYPTVYGEKVVTRILDGDTARLSLEHLGMSVDVEANVRNLLQLPHGLILVSGPTGSGKTTTLYALIRELQSASFNIISIEDPVEYRLPGVNQSQVNTQVGWDFANGLRAILRQDPDVILVGEIRDSETAKIATAAALTGHLVLSTIHTNTAAEVLTRLLDMEIPPYLVASSVCGVLAQRLIRRLCPECRKERAVTEEERAVFNWPSEVVYEARGCAKCHQTGYNGRIGIHEYLAYSPTIKEMVLHKDSAIHIEKMSKRIGMVTLKEDALLKAASGITSLQEVLRIWADQ
ncbi:GspE/PulE family protein [Dehalobacter sp. DCM]|uniref:GspE/PulE family protein n=1 Tax=Dehalobacter sp. DCM TaxID=2907827 RepID=UPI0030817A85|nr:GspE/PulE family protein [Dehalobacter sp. DCM]